MSNPPLNPIHRVSSAAAAARAGRPGAKRAAKSSTKEDTPEAPAGDHAARSEPGASETHEARAPEGAQLLERSGSAPARSTRSRASDPLHRKLLNIGYGNLLTSNRVVAIIAPNAAPMRRLRREAAERGKLLDATEGRRTRSIVILDSDHVVLSAIHPETLAARFVSDGDEAT